MDIKQEHKQAKKQTQVVEMDAAVKDDAAIILKQNK